jgi:cytosine permease
VPREWALDDLIPLIERSETTADSVGFLPPILRTEQETAPLARAPWYLTIAPAYLGIFVWAPFFDSLWVGDLTRLPLAWLIASAVFASLLCFGLLYFIPASWGCQTGRPLGILAASTFGTVGSEWITGIGVGVACIFWYAVAIDYAVDSTLLGLKACGLIVADSLHAWNLGPIVVKCPVYLCTALFWIYITGTAGLWKLPGVVVALMRVYAPIALLLLTAVALGMLPNVGSYSLETATMIVEKTGFTDRWRGHGSVVQLMTGFFAMAGLASVDWGATVMRRRDVVLDGLTGIVLTGSWTAIMSLLVVTGAAAQLQNENTWWWSDDPFRLSFRWAVFYGIGGVPGGAILILFGLAALAPACYSTWVYGQKLSTHWPRLGQSGWTWIGGAIAFVLGATSYASQIEWTFSVMGDVFAPAVGAIAGDWLRTRGVWPGIRPGVNRLGLVAWGAGFGVALVLEVDRAYNPGSIPWWRSTAICGFVASFVVYVTLAGLVRKRLTAPVTITTSDGRGVL